MARVFMKGTEAIAEAAVRAGCRFFAGYPITPQNEIPEYLARRLPEVGGSFVQGEREVASINMVYGAAGTGARVITSSSSPGISLKQEGSETVLTFGYQLGGVPIRFADGSAAAEVILSGRTVSALTLRPRQYTAETASALLPLRQAMAIAGRNEGTELSIGYADTGTYPLSAVWLAD